jgi:hypothetical protein
MAAIRDDGTLSARRAAEPLAARRVRVGILVLAGALLLVNAVRQPPLVGYDARSHLSYAEVLAQGRLPGPAESHEWYSPPLAYVVPAMALAAGLSLEASAKVSQLVNAGLGLAILLALVRLGRRVWPADPMASTVAVGLLAMLPVFYKTLSQAIRGETWLALLAVLLAERILGALDGGSRPARTAVEIAVLAGLSALARQWGLPMLAGAVLFLALAALRNRGSRRSIALAAGALCVGALLLGGWFYAQVRYRHAGDMASAWPHVEFALSNQPSDFYFGTGNGKLFTLPLRPEFPNQLVPIFYAEVWGDYWCYFVCRGWADDGTPLWGAKLQDAIAAPGVVVSNRQAVGAYLGRVNLVSLLPSLLLVAGVLRAGASLVTWLRGDDDGRGAALGFLLVAGSLAGYAWFLVCYSNPGKGDTIKGTYMLQIFPLLAWLGADLLARVRGRSPRAFAIVAAALVVAGVHGLGACVTRFGPP